MWEEDNDAVEGGAVEGEAAETVEVAEESAEPEAVAVSAEAEDTVETAPEVFDWNGELESLRTEQWYNKLDDSLRGAIDRGFENKYNNWARGYQKKFDELSKQRREAESLMDTARQEQKRAMQWLHGDVDPLVEKQQEIDNLKLAHKSAIQALREQAEQEHEKAKTAFGSNVEEAQKARDEALQQAVTLQTQLDEFNKELTEREVDELEGYLTANANDVFEHDEAFDEFLEQWKSGKSVDVAIKVARAIYDLSNEPEPEPVPEPEPEPDPVPEGMKLMNMTPDTAAATEGGEPRSFEEIMFARKMEAQREAELIRNS
tara:strand:+ start:104 stop:1054 length:951 start_codon:yes stop_codon:yes gene_type:complete